MALTIVHRLCDRLLLQTEIDADFSDIVFSFIDERDQDARKRMLEEYWGLTDHADPPHSPSCHEEEEELQDDKGDTYTSTSTPPGEYSAEVLLMEQIVAAVSFAVDALFLHYEIYQFVSFFNQTLKMIAELDQASQEVPTLSQALKQFETVLIPHYSSKITEHNFLEAVDYIKQTIFQHFHLYQFLLTKEQPVDLTSLYLPVETLPDAPLPLAQGIEEEEWHRRERVRELEQEHAQKEREMIESHKMAQAEVEERLKKAYQTEFANIEEVGDGKLMTVEEVAQVFDSLLTAHVEVTTSTVTHAMQRQRLALNARLEKMEVLSTKSSNASLSPSPNCKKASTSPMGKKSRNPSSLSISAN